MGVVAKGLARVYTGLPITGWGFGLGAPVPVMDAPLTWASVPVMGVRPWAVAVHARLQRRRLWLSMPVERRLGRQWRRDLGDGGVTRAVEIDLSCERVIGRNSDGNEG